MKKLCIILLMGVVVLPSWAQLGYQKVWEKPYGSNVTCERPDGYWYPNSYLTPDGSTVLEIPFRKCVPKCSTTVLYRVIGRDSTFKAEVNYTRNGEYANFINNSFVQGVYYEEGQNNRYSNIIYDENYTYKVEIETPSSYNLIQSVSKIPSGGMLVSSSTPNILWRFDTAGKVVWKYAIRPSYYRYPDETDFNRTTSSGRLFHHNGVSAYITTLEVRNRANFSELISSSKQLVIVDVDGREKSKTDMGQTLSSSRLIGVDNANNWVVFSDNMITKWDDQGRKINQIPITLPEYFIGDLNFQSTPDGGFVLYNPKQGNGKIAKYSSTGALMWSVGEGSTLNFVDRIKVLPSGRIVGYSRFSASFLLAEDGTFVLKDGNLVWAADGGFYWINNEKLYAFTPAGQIAWSIPNQPGLLSLDEDGGILVTQTIRTTNPNAAEFLRLVDWGFIHTFKLVKYTKSGKKAWELPINLPVSDPNQQVNFVGSVLPSKNGGYVIPQILVSVLPNPHIGKQENFSYQTLLTKITGPCYKKLDAVLKTKATTVCEGQKFELVSNTDSLGLLKYQWQRNSQPLATTKQQTFEATGGGTYRVVVSDSVCGTSFTSPQVEVTNRTIPTPNVTINGPTDFCEGSSTTSLSLALHSPTLKYQWLKNGLPLQGSFQNNLTITSTGTYQVESVDTTCRASARSIGVPINVRPLPEASISTESVGIVYAPFKVLLKANQGTDLSYQWMKQGTEIGGATASSLDVGESGSYSVRVTKSGCSRTSQSLEVTILQPLSIAPELEKEIKLYPNPNRGVFVVELPEDWTNAELVVYDSAGRRVGFERVSSQLQIQGMGGSYWLKVQHQDKSTTKQFSVVP